MERNPAFPKGVCARPQVFQSHQHKLPVTARHWILWAGGPCALVSPQSCHKMTNGTTIIIISQSCSEAVSEIPALTPLAKKFLLEHRWEVVCDLMELGMCSHCRAAITGIFIPCGTAAATMRFHRANYFIANAFVCLCPMLHIMSLSNVVFQWSSSNNEQLTRILHSIYRIWFAPFRK